MFVFIRLDRSFTEVFKDIRSYGRWLQEALRWQWIDFQFQKDLSNREIDVQEVQQYLPCVHCLVQLAEKKKRDFLKAMDVRLAQLCKIEINLN